jgi:hypothetical protein
MAASNNQIEDQWMDARHALLERIVRDTQGGTDASQLNELAEAYAWLTSVNQSHGGK